MRTVRRSQLRDFGEPYRIPQATQQRLSDLLVDVPMFIGQRPDPWWFRALAFLAAHPAWRHVLWLWLYACLLVLDIVFGGGRFEVAR